MAASTFTWEIPSHLYHLLHRSVTQQQACGYVKAPLPTHKPVSFLLTSEIQGSLGTPRTGPAAWQLENISYPQTDRRGLHSPRKNPWPGSKALSQPKEKEKFSSTSLFGGKAANPPRSKTSSWLPLFFLPRN